MTEGEMGLLGQLALRQEEYRGLLRDLREESPDEGFLKAATKQTLVELSEDELIAVATVRFEMEEYAHVSHDELTWAGELLDHLDTLGWKLGRK